jgi:HK97 family phage prohead protease
MLKKSKFFYGYASIFNEIDFNKDVILKESFNWEGEQLPLLLEHNPRKIIGEVSKITQNEKGLFVEGKIHEYFAKKELKLSVGYIPSISFASKNGIRYLSKLKLIEISVVKKPANKNAFAICI